MMERGQEDVKKVNLGKKEEIKLVVFKKCREIN